MNDATKYALAIVVAALILGVAFYLGLNDAHIYHHRVSDWYS